MSPETGTSGAADVAGRLEDGFRACLGARLATGPGAVLPARGTGGFFSLGEDEDEDEDRRVVAVTVEKLLRDFHVPLAGLRERVPGCAVSPVKAAARLRGRPVGPVRAPLTAPSDRDLADLRTLLTAGPDLVGAAL